MNNLLKTILVNKFWILFLIIFIVVGITGVRYLAGAQSERPVLIVTQRDVSEYVQLSGEVVAAEESNLSFGVTGKVVSIEVAQGVSVEAGDILSRLEDSHVSSALAQAQGGVAAAKANVLVANAALQKANSNLATVQAQNRGIDDTIASTLTTLEQTKTEQATLVANAYQELLSNDLQSYQIDGYRTLSAPEISGSYDAAASGEYILEFYRSGARSGYSIRYSGLENGTVSIDDFGLPVELGASGLFVSLPTTAEGYSYSNTEWVVPVPNTRSATYQTKLSAYKKAVEVEKQAITQAEANLDNLLAQQEVDGREAITTAQEAQAMAVVKEAEANVIQMQAALQQANAQVAQVEAQIADTIIAAPFDGVVAKIDLQVGDTVGATTPVITLVSDGGYELQVNVPEIEVAKINIGDEASVSLDAYGDSHTWTGTITEIELVETEVEGVPVYVSTVKLNETDDRIRVGMNARARIDIQTKQQVVAIPASYLSSEEDSSVVFVQVNNQVERRSVTPGLRGTNNYIEIIEGLSAGESLIKPTDR